MKKSFVPLTLITGVICFCGWTPFASATLRLNQPLIETPEVTIYADHKDPSLAHALIHKAQGHLRSLGFSEQSSIHDCEQAQAQFSKYKNIQQFMKTEKKSVKDLENQTTMDQNQVAVLNDRANGLDHQRRETLDEVKKIQQNMGKLPPSDPRYRQEYEKIKKLNNHIKEVTQEMLQIRNQESDLLEKLAFKEQQIEQKKSSISQQEKELEDTQKDLNQATAAFQLTLDWVAKKEQLLKVAKAKNPQIQDLLMESFVNEVKDSELGTLVLNDITTIKDAEKICKLVKQTNPLTIKKKIKSYGIQYGRKFSFLTEDKIDDLYGLLSEMEKRHSSNWTTVQHVVEATSLIYDFLPQKMEPSTRAKLLMDVFDGFYFVINSDFSYSELNNLKTIKESLTTVSNVDFDDSMILEFNHVEN